jgi:glycosyltransferase involved in cell wall biosynthesis
MQVLFLSYWYPEPPDNGSKLRINNLIRALCTKHTLDLLSFSQSETAPLEGDMGQMCRKASWIPTRPYNQKSLKAMIGFLAPEPRSVIDTYSPLMKHAVNHAVAEQRYDLIITSQIGMLPYTPDDARAIKLLEEVEVGTIYDAYKRAINPQTRLRAWLTWIKMKHYVAQAILRFSACTVVSETEKSLLKLVSPEYKSIFLVPNGVDTNQFRPTNNRPNPESLVYNGALTYQANFDAMDYFVNQIFPTVLKNFPSTILSITGSTEGVDLRHLQKQPQVELTGYLDDIRPVVTNAWACVVPLRQGGGTRLKILEAMALGTPVISTSKGAQGLDVRNAENILIADTPIEFADQVVRLLENPGLRQFLSVNGRKLVESRYSWDMIGDQFVDLLENLVTDQNAENRFSSQKDTHYH